MNTKGVNFQPSKRGQFSPAVDMAFTTAVEHHNVGVGHGLARIGDEEIGTLTRMEGDPLRAGGDDLADDLADHPRAHLTVASDAPSTRVHRSPRASCDIG